MPPIYRNEVITLNVRLTRLVSESYRSNPMQVRILKPAKTAMQSGIRKTKKWIIQFPVRDRQDPNPLMGWAQSNDTLKQIKLEFDSKEDAIAYAQSKGYDFTVEEPELPQRKPKAYSDNFKFNKIS